MLGPNRPTSTFWNTIILLIGIAIITWWNNHITRMELKAYQDQYNQDVKEDKERFETRTKILNGIDIHSAQIQKILEILQREHPTTKDGE